jgi:hypothetical protein
MLAGLERFTSNKLSEKNNQIFYTPLNLFYHSNQNKI